jgi:hypothetical protein
MAFLISTNPRTSDTSLAFNYALQPVALFALKLVTAAARPYHQEEERIIPCLDFGIRSSMAKYLSLFAYCSLRFSRPAASSAPLQQRRNHQSG